MSTPIQKKEKERTWKIKLVATFGVVYPENATNICMALAQAGRYVQIHRRNSAYDVEIYELVQ